MGEIISVSSQNSSTLMRLYEEMKVNRENFKSIETRKKFILLPILVSTSITISFFVYFIIIYYYYFQSDFCYSDYLSYYCRYPYFSICLLEISNQTKQTTLVLYDLTCSCLDQTGPNCSGIHSILGFYAKSPQPFFNLALA